jgi:hypothetical protein
VGAKFAAEEINKKGGILCRPVELPPQGDPDKMFTVRNPIPGEKAAGPVDNTGCKVQWPA